MILTTCYRMAQLRMCGKKYAGVSSIWGQAAGMCSAPSTISQPDVPPENVVAMFDSAHELGEIPTLRFLISLVDPSRNPRRLIDRASGDATPDALPIRTLATEQCRMADLGYGTAGVLELPCSTNEQRRAGDMTTKARGRSLALGGLDPGERRCCLVLRSVGSALVPELGHHG